MDFKSFITESADPIADEIAANCSQYLKEIMTKKSGWESMPLLYRGFTSDQGLVKKIVPRTDRTPRDTSRDTHNNFNIAFHKLYGVKDIRSKAVFCTGRKGDARYYGNEENIYVIFPVNGYTYWWNESIEDIGPELQAMFEPSAEDIYDFLKPPIREYNNNNLRGALYTGHEIMLLCKEYYAVHYTQLDTLEYIKEKALEL